MAGLAPDERVLEALERDSRAAQEIRDLKEERFEVVKNLPFRDVSDKQVRDFEDAVRRAGKGKRDHRVVTGVYEKTLLVQRK